MRPHGLGCAILWRLAKRGLGWPSCLFYPTSPKVKQCCHAVRLRGALRNEENITSARMMMQMEKVRSAAFRGTTCPAPLSSGPVNAPRGSGQVRAKFRGQGRGCGQLIMGLDVSRTWEHSGKAHLSQANPKNLATFFLLELVRS